MLDAFRGWVNELKYPRLLVFGLGMGAGLFMTLVVWPHQDAVMRSDDPYSFSLLGQRIAEGHGLAQLLRPDLPSMRRAPLYPGMIAVLYLLGGTHTILVRLMQCVIAGGTAVLTFMLGERVFSKQVGLLAAVLCAFHPMVVRYVPDIQVECVLTFFTTLMVYCGVRFLRKPSIATGAALGVTGALGALVKGVLLVCPPIFALCWLIRQLRRREPLRLDAVAAIAIAMCVVILPWTARNYVVSGGQIVPISVNAGGEFLRGYVFAQPKYYLLQQRPYVEGENEANQMEIDLFKSQGLVWERDEAETERVVSKAAKEKLRSDPAGFVRKFAIGVFSFWYELTNRKNSLVIGGLAALSWLFAALGLRAAHARNIAFWPLVQPIVTINLLYAALLALGRYSAPTIPTLMVLTSWGITCVVQKLKQTPRIAG